MTAELVQKAKEFAVYCHRNQVRKYTGEPYVHHVIAVAEMVLENSLVKPSDEMIAAALLHDTVEDTEATIEQIQEKFGDTVAEYVWYLTKPPEFVGNREKRKKHDRARLSEAPDEVKFIKVMDIWHNSLSIREHDPEFWERFRAETREMLYVIDAFAVVKKYAGKEFASNDFLKWVAIL